MSDETRGQYRGSGDPAAGDPHEQYRGAGDPGAAGGKPKKKSGGCLTCLGIG